MTGVVGLIALLVVLTTLHAVGGRRPVVRALWFAGGGIVAAVAAYLITAPLGLPAFGFFSGALLVETQPIAGADAQRQQAGPQRRLHVQQGIEAAPLKLPPDLAITPPAQLLVEGDHLDAG